MNDSRSLLPQDAEDDIRRHVTRHYNQVVEIEQLRTELEHWRRRAASAEREAEITARHVLNLEEKKDQLLATIAMLKTQFDVGAQCWLNGYEALRHVDARMLPRREIKKIPPVQDGGRGSESFQSGGSQHSGEGNGQQDGRHADREDRFTPGSGDDEHRPVPRSLDDAGERPESEHDSTRAAAESGQPDLSIGSLVQS